MCSLPLNPYFNKIFPAVHLLQELALTLSIHPFIYPVVVISLFICSSVPLI